jgi:hypothetical protein
MYEFDKKKLDALDAAFIGSVELGIWFAVGELVAATAS